MNTALHTPSANLDPALAPLVWPKDAPLVALAGHDPATDPRHRFPTIAAQPAATIQVPNTKDAFQHIDHALTHARRRAASRRRGFAGELAYEPAAAPERPHAPPPPASTASKAAPPSNTNTHGRAPPAPRTTPHAPSKTSHPTPQPEPRTRSSGATHPTPASDTRPPS